MTERGVGLEAPRNREDHPPAKGETMAELKVTIEKIGDDIAQRENYIGLKGREAVFRYLIDKYRWLPEQVRGLSDNDLSLLLAGYEEKGMTDWD